VDFSCPFFFDRAPNVMAKLHTRDLIYDCPPHVRIYLEATAEYYKEHKVEKRLIDLSQSTQDDEKAESIDRDITRGMLAAQPEHGASLLHALPGPKRSMKQRLNYIFSRLH
jgi:hypothetical protein